MQRLPLLVLALFLGFAMGCPTVDPGQTDGEEDTGRRGRRDRGREVPDDQGRGDRGRPDDVSERDLFDLSGDFGRDSGGGDGAPCTGLGCACSAATEDAVCNGLACVDGVCCDSACEGPCRGCNLSGRRGSCSPWPEGTSVLGCPLTAEHTCGTTGTCDGAGECAYWGSETSCDDGEACSQGDACDGAGTCRGEVPDSCGPGPGNECCVGSCSDSGGCSTVASACEDVCGADVLTVGGTCSGCGAAGGVGVCAGGGTYRCDASSHDLCQTVRCGGVDYWCTESEGTWAWRATSVCNDGDLCTYGDVCSGGVCEGLSVTCADSACVDRECNGTNVCTSTPRTGQACEDGDPCTFGGTCDASGTCNGGSTVTCEDAACVDRACDGSGGCTETVRTGGACEDGDLCTYNDTCNSGGVCVAGSTVTCTGTETTCLTYACNGTATCAPTPRNVGGACDDGDPETEGDVCGGDGVCAGDSGCPPPLAACSTGTQNRRGCGGARTISRAAAGAAGGWSIIDQTCGGDNDFDDDGPLFGDDCWDANNDHAYRIYLREGEWMSVRLFTGESCDGGYGWGGTLKLFETGGCESASCASDWFYCRDLEDDQTTTHTATQDGWVIIVADGSHASDDEGAYRLTVTLACEGTNCGCP